MKYDCGIHIKLTCAACLLLVVGGCATTKDPSAGGFISGVAALSSGAYEERLEQKEQTLQQEQLRLDRLRNQAAKSEKKKLVITRELSIIERHSVALRKQTVDLKRQVERARQARGKDEHKYQQLLSEVDALEEHIGLVSTNPTLSNQEKLAEIDALTRKRVALEQVLDTLLQ